MSNNFSDATLNQKKCSKLHIKEKSVANKPTNKPPDVEEKELTVVERLKMDNPWSKVGFHND